MNCSSWPCVATRGRLEKLAAREDKANNKAAAKIYTDRLIGQVDKDNGNILAW
jgi:hypothetical protein